MSDFENDISIIVPIYNAEKHLSRCIDSILTQTYRNFELILVDDGSLDGSGVICDDYAKQDSRIKVIHQKNAGVSAARNAGIALSCGCYIGFVDADDCVVPEMYKRLMTVAMSNNADVVMCDAVTVYSDGMTEADTITQLGNGCVLLHNNITAKLLLEMAGAAWRCIYSAELIRSNGIQFPVGIKLSEDRIFNIKCFGSAKRLCYVKEAYYKRTVNKESAVHRFHADHFESCKRAFEVTAVAIKDFWGDDEEFHQAYQTQFISGAIGSICNYYYKTSPFSCKERRSALKDVCEDEALCLALKTVGSGVVSRMMLHKQYNLLILYAKLANIKHGR